jgi:hypothetical protein
MVGGSEEPRLMAPFEAVAVADANRDVIVGIKVRVGQRASGRSGVAPLDIALQAAAEAGMPVMCHIDIPPPSYEGLERLRLGCATFRRGSKKPPSDGVLDRIHHALYVACREKAEREANPTAAIIDSQSVKSAGRVRGSGFGRAILPRYSTEKLSI